MRAWCGRMVLGRCSQSLWAFLLPLWVVAGAEPIVRRGRRSGHRTGVVAGHTLPRFRLHVGDLLANRKRLIRETIFSRCARPTLSTSCSEDMLPSGLGERGNEGGWSRGLAGAVRLAPGKELFEPSFNGGHAKLLWQENKKLTVVRVHHRAGRGTWRWRGVTHRGNLEKKKELKINYPKKLQIKKN